jgi:hypothetical protein
VLNQFENVEVQHKDVRAEHVLSELINIPQTEEYSYRSEFLRQRLEIV